MKNFIDAALQKSIDLQTKMAKEFEQLEITVKLLVQANEGDITIDYRSYDYEHDEYLLEVCIKNYYFYERECFACDTSDDVKKFCMYKLYEKFLKSYVQNRDNFKLK